MAGAFERLPRVRAGDPLSAAAWNALVDALNRNRLLLGQDSGIDAQYTPFGTALRATAGGQAMTLALTSSAITARSGTTAGTGTATPKKFDGTTISSTGEADLTVYNFSAATGGIASGLYVWLAADPDGYYWVTSVECA